jgi:hypothetical protein
MCVHSTLVLILTAILTLGSCVTKIDELLTHDVNAKRTFWTYGRDELSPVAEIHMLNKQVATQTFLVLRFLHTKTIRIKSGSH